VTSLTDSTPILPTTYDGLFPKRDCYNAVWEEILQVSGTWQAIDCAAHIRTWCGSVPGQVVTGLAGVNHIGIYLGDYQRDDEVLEWHAFLAGIQQAGRITDLEIGPSYIAPRQYGTQGWWCSLTLEDGHGIETFTCKSYGPWLERGADERRRLMSHVAVEVRAEPDVRAALDTLERAEDHLEIIAFTETDELGHTYGHLRNNIDQTVLEIVHQALPTETGSPHGAH
jgi:hypothetical protein